MDNYIIKLGDKEICELKVLQRDERMGVITASFIPKGEYTIIQDIIRKHSEEILEIDYNDNENTECSREIEGLDLSLYINDINQNADKIELRDYSEELGEEGYEVYIYLR